MSSGQTPMSRHNMIAEVALLRPRAKTAKAIDLIATFDAWCADYDALMSALRAAEAAKDLAGIAAAQRAIQSHRASPPSVTEIAREIDGENLRGGMRRYDRSDVGNRDGADDMIRENRRDVYGEV